MTEQNTKTWAETIVEGEDITTERGLPLMLQGLGGLGRSCHGGGYGTVTDNTPGIDNNENKATPKVEYGYQSTNKSNLF